MTHTEFIDMVNKACQAVTEARKAAFEVNQPAEINLLAAAEDLCFVARRFARGDIGS